MKYIYFIYIYNSFRYGKHKHSRIQENKYHVKLYCELYIYNKIIFNYTARIEPNQHTDTFTPKKPYIINSALKRTV